MSLGVAVFAVLGLRPLGVTAQESTIRSCDRSCDLTFQVVVTLGDTTREGEGFVGWPAALLQTHDGRFLLADRLDPGSIKVFDRAGRFLRRVGREGSGPGEYQLINFIFPRGPDSVEVLDIGLQRATILGPELAHVRTYRVVGGRSDLVRTVGGTYITAARINQPASVGLPLHVMSQDGEVLLSFGATPPIQDVANRDFFSRKLTPAEGESFWAAHLTRYTLEQWTADGRLLRMLTRDVDWFPPQDEFGTNGPDAPPHPGLRSVHRDGQGRLWVAAVVPDPEYPRAFRPRTNRFGQEDYEIDYNRAYDTIIEVVDPDRSVVVGSGRLDAYVLGFAADGLMYSADATEEGEPIVRVWTTGLPE